MYEYMQRAFFSGYGIRGRHNGIVIPGVGNTVPFICIYLYHALCTLYTEANWLFVQYKIQACHCPSLGGQHFCVPLLWRGPVRPPISHPTWKPQGCPRDQLIRPVISAVVSWFSWKFTSCRRKFRQKSCHQLIFRPYEAAVTDMSDLSDSYGGTRRPKQCRLCFTTTGLPGNRVWESRSRWKMQYCFELLVPP
jgi:hypothetical protein